MLKIYLYYEVQIVFLPACLSVGLAVIHTWMIQVRPPNPYYLESLSAVEYLKHVYMATPFSIFQNSWNYIFSRKQNGATGLKHWCVEMTWLCE